jgi:flagellar assembly protein FliH
MSSAAAPGDAARSIDAGLLGQYMAGMRGTFSAADPGDNARRERRSEPRGPVSFSPAPEPRHFRPADPGVNPTAGWDPFTADSPETPAPEQPQPTAHDPLSKARAEGFAEGFAAAQAEATGHVQDAEAMERLTQALAQAGGFDRETLASRLRQTVLFLVTRLVGETGVSADLMAERIDNAVGLLADSSEPALLRLNPDDLKLVEGRFPDRVFAIADKAVERGGFLIETKTTVIEDGPAAWLAQLAAAIDRTALPDPR